ncbi:MAG: ankyrin repeat domain-containing protein [Dehalococcoidia bacterium]
MPVTATVLGAASQTTQPRSRPAGRPVERFVAFTYYPLEAEGLDAFVVSPPQQRVRYPVKLRIRLFWLINTSASGPQSWIDTESLGMIAFTDGCWPTLAAEWPEPPRGCLSRMRREGDNPTGPARASITFYPRSRRWGLDVLDNLGGPGGWGWGWFTRPLIEAVDRSRHLSDTDRLMVYRQCLEVLQRAAPMERAWMDEDAHDAAQRSLRERITALCRASGAKPPPAPDDADGWLALVKADVASKGIKDASAEWMGAMVDAGLAKCVKFLLAEGADPDRYVHSHYPSPLRIAARRGHIAVARELLAAGADIDASTGDSKHQRRALHTAVFYRKREMAEFLLDNGADVNAAAIWGPDHETALGMASVIADIEIVELLLARGAKVKSQKGQHATALHRACKGLFVCREFQGDPGRVPVVAALLKHGADPNATDRDGNTALHVAIDNGRGDLLPLLLEHGGDPSAKNKEGQTPLMLANERGNYQATALLRKHGAKK